MAAGEPRAGLWPLLAVAVGVLVFAALGNWQLGRAAEKRALKAQYDAQADHSPISLPATLISSADVELRRVEARGVFDARHTVLVDNRIRRGVVGFHVITPLRINRSEQHVLVNRGWIAGTRDRAHPPQVRTPEGEVMVSGVAIVPGRRIFELSKDVTEGSIWQNLTIERYRAAVPISIQPFVLRQDSALDDGLVREWDPPDFGIDKHYGYAFQWFALGVTLLVFYATSRYRRAHKPAA